MIDNSFLPRFLLAGLLALSAAHAQDPVPKGYEIGERSVSPDGRLAVLYPTRSGNSDESEYPPNLLVRLSPYKVLANVCDPGFPEGANTRLLTEWEGNSLLALYQFRKWGILDLKVYELEKDQVARVHSPWDAVREIFRKDFRERFLKKFPQEAETIIFISDEGEENPRRDFEIKGRKVLLEVRADNKPNLAAGPHWSAELRATWNLDTGRLERVKFQPGKISVRRAPEE